MKKILVIALSILSISLSASYQTTNLDFLWNGEYVESGGKFYAKDSITDAIYTDVEFIGIDTSLSYLSGKSGGAVAWWGDTIDINRIFQNQNFADTLFSKWEERTINADSTENLPYRITYIGHYSAATTDTDNFWATPAKATVDFNDIGVGKTYTTWSSAYSAASINDTMYIYDGTYTQPMQNAKSLKIFCIGNVKFEYGTSYVYQVNSINTELHGASLNGLETATFVVQWVANGLISNCYLQGGATYESSGNYGETIKKTTVVSNNSVAAIIGHPINIIDCNINNTAGTSIYNLSSSGVSLVEYSIINNTGVQSIWVRYNGTARYRYNYITGANNSALIASNYSTSTQNAYIYGNTIHSSTALTNAQLYLQSSGDANYYVYDNTFTMSNSTKRCVYVISANAEAYNNDFTITGSSTHLGAIYTASITATPITLNAYSNNVLTSGNSGYAIGAGTESTGIYDNTISVTIEKNYIEGTIAKDNLLHSIFVGFNNDPIIRYNYVYKSGYGTVFKASGDDYTSENISYNVFDSCNFGDRIKGIDSVDIYNHTYNNCIQGINISNNEGSGTANGTKIYNSIFNNCPVIYTIGSGGEIFESDYNILYNGTLNGGSFATWQSLGFDENSFITDPNFKSSTELWPVIPSNAITNGLDSGTTYNQGLDVSSVWPDAVVLKTQPTYWTMGAYPIDAVPGAYVNYGKYCISPDGSNLIITYE